MEMVVGGGVCLYLSLQVGPGLSEFQWTCTNCMVRDAVLVRLVMCRPGLKAASQPKLSPLRPSSVKPLQGLVWPVAQASLLQSREPWPEPQLCAADNEACKQLLW